MNNFKELIKPSTVARFVIKYHGPGIISHERQKSGTAIAGSPILTF